MFRSIAYAALLPMVLLAPGCAERRTLRFHVVDSLSGASLAGVNVHMVSDMQYTLLSNRHVHREMDLPVTGADGMVRVAKVGAALNHRFIFTRDRYDSAAIYASPELKSIRMASPLTERSQDLSPAVVQGGMVVVPMHPIAEASPQ